MYILRANDFEGQNRTCRCISGVFQSCDCPKGQKQEHLPKHDNECQVQVRHSTAQHNKIDAGDDDYDEDMATTTTAATVSTVSDGFNPDLPVTEITTMILRRTRKGRTTTTTTTAPAPPPPPLKPRYRHRERLGLSPCPRPRIGRG